MSTITLRAYLEELNALLEQEALEEVIGHCRHLLQYFPKNLETYRLLGKSLLEKARYDEALEVFPRLLSADPSDFIAHVGLSTIYEYQEEIGRALWHMERAFEQMPNNALVADEIRRLYERMGHPAPEKIKMTRGALAKQYANNKMYDQAISEVRQALDESPQRLDLKILLADALWKANFPLEAGETALEILQVLPDCLEANKLMASLWIASKRPDDAQVFLKRVEALAPYESLKLIYRANNRSEDVPDSAFTITRLDWNATSMSASAGDSPDWVNKISDVFEAADNVALTGAESFPTGTVDVPDWLGSAVTGAAETATSDDLPDWFGVGSSLGDKPQTGNLSAPEDWFTEMTSEVSQTGSLTPPPELAQREQQAAQERASTGFTGELGEIDEEEWDEMDKLRAAARPPSPDEIAALLASAHGEDDEAEDEPQLDWMASSSDEPDWGTEASSEINDEFVPDWFAGGDDSASAIDEDEMPDWMSAGDSSFTPAADQFNEDDFSSMFGEDSAPEVESASTDQPNFLLGNIDDADGTEFASLFDDVDTSSDDWMSTSVESSASNDIMDIIDEEEEEIEDLFATGGNVSMDTSWLQESTLAPMASSAQDQDMDDEDLSNLFGNGDAGPDTSWLGAAALEGLEETPEDEEFSFEETDFGSFGTADASEIPQEFSFTVESAEESSDEDDLGSLFEDEQVGALDTSWLMESAASPESAMASTTDGDDDDDLANLFGDSDAGADTSWLGTAALEGLEANVEDEISGIEEPDFMSMFGSEEADNKEDMFASATSDDDSSLDDLGDIFEEEPAEAFNTTWLMEDASEEIDVSGDDDFADLLGDSEDVAIGEPDFSNMFGSADASDDSEEEALAFSFDSMEDDEEEELFSFSAESSASEMDSEEEELGSLFEEKPVALDTSWLTESVPSDSQAAEDEFEDDDLSSLFEEAPISPDTSWLGTAILDDLREDEPSEDELFAFTTEGEEAEQAQDDIFAFTTEGVGDDDQQDSLDGLFDEEEDQVAELQPDAAELASLFDEEASDEEEMDWLGTIGSTDFLTTENVESIDTLMAEEGLGAFDQEDVSDDELESMFGLEGQLSADVPSVGISEEVDEFETLFEDEGFSVNTDFLRSTVDAAEDIASGTIPGTGELPAWLIGDDSSAEAPAEVADMDELEFELDEFEIEEELEDIEGMFQEGTPKIDTGFLISEIENAAHHEYNEFDEEGEFEDDLELTDLFDGGSLADTGFLLGEESGASSEKPQEAFDLGAFELEEDEPELEAFSFDATDFESNLGNFEVEEASEFEDELEFDVESLFAGNVNTEESDELQISTDDLVGIFGADEKLPQTSDIDDLFAEIATKEAQAASLDEDVEDLFAEVDEDDFGMDEEVEEVEAVGEFGSFSFDSLLSDEEDVEEGELAALFEGADSLELEDDDDFGDLEFAFDTEEDDDDDFGDLEFSFDDKEEAVGAVATSSESLTTDDDDLFAAIMTGSDTTHLIEDTELAPEIDWVSDFSESDDDDLDMDFDDILEEPVAPQGLPESMSEVRTMPPPPMRSQQFVFEREPRWLRAMTMNSGASQFSGVAQNTSGLSETNDDDDFDLEEFDELLDLDEEFGDLDNFEDDNPDDDDLDWLE